MSKVIVISGHPSLENSHTNTVILDSLAQKLSNIEIRRLDELYPDYQINTEAEQAALLSADIVVLQFPFYWYSVPALLKKWIDDVFTYNFAYGPEGDKLKGKELILSFTVGGPESSYQPLGYNHFTIEQMLHPLQQTAYLAEMHYNKPIYSHGMVYIPNVYNTLEGVQEKAKIHAERLISTIETLANDPKAKIERFVKQWFEALDLLPPQSESFVQHIDDHAEIIMPEGKYAGKAGFTNWYQTAVSTFKPNCAHIVEQCEVIDQNDHFKVSLRVRLKAETFTESPFHGQNVNLLVNETWSVTITDTGPMIQRYEVELVQ